MSKILGYLSAFIGLLLIAFIVKPLKDLVFVQSITATIPMANLIFVAVGVVLIVVGIILLKSSGGSKQLKEVPIYQGKSVVGFRRMGKK
ncbi:MAG: hypothetical protein WC781_02890 [Candidatus Pacearchaeota archaeon]